jgi:hypothetical protein
MGMPVGEVLGGTAVRASGREAGATRGTGGVGAPHVPCRYAGCAGCPRAGCAGCTRGVAGGAATDGFAACGRDMPGALDGAEGVAGRATAGGALVGPVGRLAPPPQVGTAPPPGTSPGLDGCACIGLVR